MVAVIRCNLSVFLAAALLMMCASVSAETAPPDAPPSKTVFQEFADTSLERTFMRQVLQLFATRQYAAAERSLRRLADKFPQSALYRYNLGAALARQGRAGEALESLEKAVDLGFSNRAIFEGDADLGALRKLPRYAALLAKVDAAAKRGAAQAKAAPVPALIADRRARVEEANTGLQQPGNLLVSYFRFPPKAAGATVRTGKDAAAKRLNDLFRAGKAAGNHGDLYDNRDRGHSGFSRNLMPQVSHIEYGAAARAVSLDYGVNPGLLFNAITFGNSSTAFSHKLVWRSQARLVLTTPGLTAAANLQYLNNHLYVFPEHLDHDGRRGDLLPANTPYMLISQGSSGSDQPFLNAIGVILAAFRPEVKAFLRQRRLVMPTVQMVLRRGQKWVRSDEDYLTGRAHPSVFSAEDIDLPALIDLANGLTKDSVPPSVQLAVIEEDKLSTGIDIFTPPGMNEALFSTPGAIARLVRSSRYWTRLVVLAERTRDPNGRPLKFHWKVLRGDIDRITVRPLDKNGTKAEIRVPWHDRQPLSPGSKLTTDRVDIGVFADNGKMLSVPSFVTFLFPGDQKRTYTAGGRLKCIDYDKPGYRDRYVDPVIFPARDWRDCYDFDERGRLIGWNRIKGGALQRFTYDGAKVTETDAQGRPVLAQRVRYGLKASKSVRPAVEPVLLDAFVRYRYRDAQDRIGVASPVQDNKMPN